MSEAFDPSIITSVLQNELPPSTVDDINRFLAELRPLIDQFYATSTNSAACSLFNHAVNDVQDLVVDVIEGRGRPAARAARALFEHAVNLHDVIGNQTSATRYEDHRAVFAQLLASHRPGLSILTGKERERARRDYEAGGRRTKHAYERAIESYGSRFRLGWSQGNLLQRSQSLSLDHGYDGYRLLSAVVHGNAGGLLGTTRTVNAMRVHRTGPDLQLCWLAWVEGLQSFRGILPSLSRCSGVDVTRTHVATDKLLSLWPRIRRAVRRVDQMLWPTEPPAHDYAVLVLYSQTEKWYYCSPASRSITRAVSPPDASGLAAAVRTLLYEEGLASYPSTSNGRPLAVEILDLQVEPRASQAWFPVESMLPMEEFEGEMVRSQEPTLLSVQRIRNEIHRGSTNECGTAT